MKRISVGGFCRFVEEREREGKTPPLQENLVLTICVEYSQPSSCADPRDREQPAYRIHTTDFLLSFVFLRILVFATFSSLSFHQAFLS